MSGDTDPDARFKLVPTPADRELFHLIVESGLETDEVLWVGAPDVEGIRQRLQAVVDHVAATRCERRSEGQS